MDDDKTFMDSIRAFIEKNHPDNLRLMDTITKALEEPHSNHDCYGTFVAKKMAEKIDNYIFSYIPDQIVVKDEELIGPISSTEMVSTTVNPNGENTPTLWKPNYCRSNGSGNSACGAAKVRNGRNVCGNYEICKHGEKAQFADRCMYLKFDEYCDSVAAQTDKK